MARKRRGDPISLTTDFVIKDVPKEHVDLVRSYLQTFSEIEGKTPGQIFAELMVKECFEKLGDMETNHMLAFGREFGHLEPTRKY